MSGSSVSRTRAVTHLLDEGGATLPGGKVWVACSETRQVGAASATRDPREVKCRGCLRHLARHPQLHNALLVAARRLDDVAGRRGDEGGEGHE